MSRRRSLARGDDVVVLDDLSTGKRENLPEGAELVERDIREPQAELFARVKPTACFHLAAQADVRVSVARPEHDARINVLGTVNLLQAAREHDTQVVFSSTGGAIYGECERPATEDAPRRPLAPYGTSKLAGEEYLATYNRLHGTRHVRCATATSTGRGRTRTARRGVVAIFSSRSLSGEQPRIFGDGSRRATTSTSATSCAATLAAAEQDGGVFNVGTGRETSVVELLRAVPPRRGHRGVEAVFAPPRPGELQRSVLDIEPRGGRARLAAGAQPRGRPARDLGVDEPLGKERGSAEANHVRPVEISAPAPRQLDRPGVPRRSSRAALRCRARPPPDRRHRMLSKPLSAHAEAVGGDAGAGNRHVPAPRPEPKARPSPGQDLRARPERERNRRSSRRRSLPLDARGYPIRGTANAARSYGRSVVMYRPGRLPEGKRLASDLGVSLVGPLDGLAPRQLHGAQLVVVLGT